MRSTQRVVTPTVGASIGIGVGISVHKLHHEVLHLRVVREEVFGQCDVVVCVAGVIFLNDIVVTLWIDVIWLL